MKVETVATVIGARYYDITDERTGEVKRYTSIFTVQQSENQPDRCGMEAGKLRGDSSELVKQLSGMKLPADLRMEIELSVNAKGESKPRVLRIVGPAKAS